MSMHFLKKHSSPLTYSGCRWLCAEFCSRDRQRGCENDRGISAVVGEIIQIWVTHCPDRESTMPLIASDMFKVNVLMTEVKMKK